MVTAKYAAVLGGMLIARARNLRLSKLAGYLSIVTVMIRYHHAMTATSMHSYIWHC